MSVEFEEEKYIRPASIQTPTSFSIVSFLIKYGICKTEQEANQFLFLIAVFTFVAALVIFGYYVLGIGQNTTPNPYYVPIQ